MIAGILRDHDSDAMARTSDLRPLSAILSATLLLSACAPSAPPGSPAQDAPPPSSAADAPVDTPPVAPEAPVPGRSSQYTDLDTCSVIASTPEEAGYRVTECAGPDGYLLRRVELDARENLELRKDGGDFVSLELPALVDGVFNSLGERVEWRGLQRDGGFVADALVVRFAVSNMPDDPMTDTSYLLVARLTAPGPCVVAMVEPGTEQNERARAIADAGSDCLRR